MLLVFLRFVFFVLLIKQQKMPMKRLDYGFRKPNPYYIVQKHLINFFQPQCMNEHCWFVQTNHCTASSFASLRTSIKSAYTKCGVSGTAKSNCRVLTNRRRRGRKVDEIENCNFLIQPANFRQGNYDLDLDLDHECFKISIFSPKFYQNGGLAPNFAF